MSPPSNTALFTTDFRREFAQATLRLLRGRFVWFVCTQLGIGLLAMLTLMVPVIIAMTQGRDWTAVFLEGPFAGAGWLELSMMGLWYGLYAGALIWVVTGKRTDRMVLLLTMWVVFLDGLSNVMLRVAESPLTFGLVGFGLSHLIASLFLPWTPKQALKPVVPLLFISAALRLLVESPTVFGAFGQGEPGRMVGDLIAILLSPLVALPGTVVCWVRHSRRLDQYRIRFLNERYGEVRRELVDARRIHEALFPRPRQEGRVRFSYRYHPMRQIGGDFLHAASTPTSRGEGDGLSIVLLDVTGHGIPAALTVNRLHGELDRLFAEDPLMGPGEVLRMLNRYVHLTLAPHNVYATAICMRMDPDENALMFASGGHPPAFLRTVGGSVDQLDSTTFILGAVGDKVFEPGERRFDFKPGDSLVAYTDGATEAKNAEGEMLGLVGIQRLMAQRSASLGSWSSLVAAAVDGFRDGPPLDDTLVIEMFRPFDSEGSRLPSDFAERSSDEPSERPAPISL
ncbi:MAG: PP2C family protein-serine/threonine phosphatase [Planctomycetota bacterium]